jgi:hypothetical protein
LTAAYAPFVHENTEANFQKPGSKAKFLEDPFKESVDRTLAIIREEAQIR